MRAIVGHALVLYTHTQRRAPGTLRAQQPGTRCIQKLMLKRHATIEGRGQCYKQCPLEGSKKEPFASRRSYTETCQVTRHDHVKCILFTLSFAPAAISIERQWQVTVRRSIQQWLLIVALFGCYTNRARDWRPLAGGRRMTQTIKRIFTRTILTDKVER